MSALSDLLRLLELEQLDETVFRGQSQDLGWGAIFGGQVLGQAVSALRRSVDGDRRVHSLHAYFLRQGDASRPVEYDVERMRDGRSFSTRRVRAVQLGRPIFFMSASLHEEQRGLDHQDPMPEVAGPEGIESELELARRKQDLMPQALRATFTSERAIEIRPVEFMDATNPIPAAPRRTVWMRASGELPDDPMIHACLLAYASDFSFLVTALQPHGIAWWDRRFAMASIDHAMWFHRPFRIDNWLLYAVDSPNASGARALVRGQFFTRDGRLVASTVQEGLIRKRADGGDRMPGYS
jgi:acyl-CoA thioesterase-2